MATSRGTFFLARVLKHNATTELIVQAIHHAQRQDIGSSSWVFTSTENFGTSDDVHFVYGKLSKYAPDGQVTVVDEEIKEEVEREEPNIIRGSSPFVYIPNYQALAYLQSSQIKKDAFREKFEVLVNSELEKEFLAKCETEPISDLLKFYEKIGSIRRFRKISATVNPPNPSFGPLWKVMRDYLQKRRSSEIKHEEKASNDDDGLNSRIKEHVRGILEQTPDDPYEPEEVDVGDAVVLMAIDGYGFASLDVETEGRTVEVIKTDETQKSFIEERDPLPEALYNHALRILDGLSSQRQMRHE